MPFRWGMAVDLDKCTGCEACVTACHAENNIPTVSPEQAARGRAMHWLRVERYYEGDFPDVRVKFRPVLCQQCDNAPCEAVCPTYAAHHSEDGLNAQVYNRCIGTRYCANACTYNVRFFNFFNPEWPKPLHLQLNPDVSVREAVCPTYAAHHSEDGLNAQVYNRCIGTRYCANACTYNVRFFNFFNPEWPKPLHLQLNPDVSVREVGVMEKCTFCVQRIKAAKTAAKAEKRDLVDGALQPACAQACPTTAIVFGDLNNPNSRVARLAKSPRGTKLLEDLGAEPKVTYLQKQPWYESDAQ